MENMGNMIYRKGSGVKFQEPLEKRGELSSLSTYALQKKKKGIIFYLSSGSLALQVSFVGVYRTNYDLHSFIDLSKATVLLC